MLKFKLEINEFIDKYVEKFSGSYWTSNLIDIIFTEFVKFHVLMPEIYWKK
jgi:hypothetical protein